MKEIDETNIKSDEIKETSGGVEKQKRVREFIKSAAVVVALVLIITFFVKPIIVKQTSMLPTLQENNYLILSKQAYRFGSPKQGDIVVFPVETDEGEKLYIKRVIGLPGDTIDIKENEVFVNGKKQDQSFTNDGITPGYVKGFKVPKGELYVMGDNRVVSIDSRRSSVGTVPIKKIAGVAVFRLYPFNEIGRLK